MILAVDVDYRDDHALAAGVVWDSWESDRISEETTVRIEEVEAYVPGQFYRRELPCILNVLRRSGRVGTIVVDGHTWLGPGRPGLGAHLFDALDGKIPVVGVAKAHFVGWAGVEVYRGTSKRPLFVTAAGVDPEEAAGFVQRMHGPHRLPTVLKRVDALCRGRVAVTATLLGMA